MPSSFGVTPHNDNAHLTTAKRAFDGGVAGLYSCNTLLHKHINPCMEEYHFCRSTTDLGSTAVTALGGAFANLTSPSRMQVQTAVTEGSNCRVVIPTQFNVAGNFMEVSALLHASDAGVGDGNIMFIGLANSFASIVPAIGAQLAGFWKGDDEIWHRGIYNATTGIESTSTGTLGRAIQDGDLLTVRLYRKEGSANIDSYAFYVNGLRITYLEAPGSYIPTANLYPGFGVYNIAGSGDSVASLLLEIRNFNFKYNP